MFKSGFFIFKYYEVFHGEGKEWKKRSGSESVKPESEKELAEKKEKAEKKELAALYAEINQKLRDAEEHVKFNEVEGNENIKQVVIDFTRGFLDSLPEKKKNLIFSKKPVFSVKVDNLICTVRLESADFKVDMERSYSRPRQRRLIKTLLQADINELPDKQGEKPDREPKILLSGLTQKIKDACDQFDSDRTVSVGRMGMINAYVAHYYSLMTPSERASLCNEEINYSGSMDVDLVTIDKYAFRIRFLTNNYILSRQV